jgi:hypothetical protein
VLGFRRDEGRLLLGHVLYLALGFPETEAARLQRGDRTDYDRQRDEKAEDSPQNSE